MFRVREMQRMDTLYKGLVVAVLMALVFWLATRAWGAVPVDPAGLPPALLPPEVAEEAEPMPFALPQLYAEETLARRVWAALDMHRAGHVDRAATAWADLRFPAETDHWRKLALAAALLETGRLDEAAPLLGKLLDVQDHNPVVHYYAALWRLEQAARAGEWHDAVGPHEMRLAAHRPPVLMTQPRDVYELLAMEELEKTLALAANLYPEEPLLTGEARENETLPRVADLLAALGAERIEANAHNVLGDLCVRHGQAERAEIHLDAAHLAGANIGHGFRELGELYEAQDRHFDAARAYVKAVRAGDGRALPAQKVMEHLWQGLLRGE